MTAPATMPRTAGPVVDITQWYSPTSGGIRTYLHAKAHWAERAGVPHAAIVPGEEDGPSRIAGSTFVNLRGRTPARRWGYRLVVRSLGVVSALERLRPGVVVLHDALAFPRTVAEWADARGVPVVLMCHSDLALAAAGLPRGMRGPASTALGALQRRAMSVPRAVVVASDSTRRRIERHVSAPVVVSPLGVDAGVFADRAPSPELRRALVSDAGPLVLYAGRLSSEKRVDLLPEMLTHLPGDVVLAVAGTGAAAARMRRAALRLGVSSRLRMLGHVGSRAHLAELMATADCFVHPNPDEPFGLCPLEARAAGCAVVVPAGSGAADLLTGRGAVVVAPGSARALADGVVRALADPPPAADLSDLSWDAAFRREWDVYARVGGAPCA